jgi:hypothetical protein
MVAINSIAELTEAAQFSAPISVVGDLSLTISGEFTGTVTVQRSFDDGSTWLDVDAFTQPTEEVGFEPAGCQYRVGVKAGSSWSGSALIGLYGYTTWRYE